MDLRGPGPAPQLLAAVDLPSAPAVTTAPESPLRRPKLPAVGLLILGLLLTLGPIFGGMFSKTAAGEQMVNQFAPYMQADTLARYDADIHAIAAAGDGVQTVFRDQPVQGSQFPGTDAFRTQSGAIVHRASSLLDDVKATAPNYRAVARIGGFDRIPFLIVTCGIISIYGACVLLTGRRRRARSAAVLVVIASAAIAVYPFVGNLADGSQAGQKMLHSLAPIMTPHQVRQLQSDFITLVNADGELDTTFRHVPHPGAAADDIARFVAQWPRISSDLASLVGVINDNIGNFRSLDDLNALTRDVGLPGLEAFPWLLLGIGAVSATLALAAAPRPRKDPP